MLARRRAASGIVCVLAAMTLGGCAHKQPPLETTPTFEIKSALEKPPAGPLVVGPAAIGSRVAAGPVPPSAAAAASTLAEPPPLPAQAPGEALSLEQVSLPSFINEVFAKALKLNVQIDQAVATRTDLVTLRTAGPLPPRELFDMAVKVLAGYGIAVGWNGSVLRVTTDQALMTQMPAVIRSRALPEVPAALRPIFQIVELHELSGSDMLTALGNAYGTKVRLSTEPKSNALLVFGLPSDVRDVVAAAQVLDHARLAGHQSLRISPIYWTARGLADKLVQLLQAEGYDAASRPSANQANAIMVLPIEANNSIVALAADPKLLAHIRQWVGDLDQPGQADPARNIFIYSVQNTTAASLGRVIQGVLGEHTAGATAPVVAQLEAAGRTQPLPQTNLSQPGLGGPGSGVGGLSTPTAPPPPRPATQPLEQQPEPVPTQPGTGTAGPPPLRVIVDAARNALVFVGTAQDFARVRPLLEALDQAPREALIEVTVVEVDLNDATNLGVEWTLVTPLFNGAKEKLGTGPNVLPPSAIGTGGAASSVGGLPIGTTGFNYTILNSLGDMRLLLNAFAQNTHISVLSTPRILAESGGQASISVGQQVPTITSQGTTNVIQSQGTSGILQSIEYQQTGVVLNVSPVVHSGNRIDLNVSQVVSTNQGNCVAGISSPCIQNRNVATQLTLSDGQTVVIGGLISDTRTQNDSGVPYLKDVPGLGVFFRNQSPSRQRTELLIFITPYVISNDSDAAAITQQFEDQMKSWPIPNTGLHR